MCSNTKHATTASKLAFANGSCAAAARAKVAPPRSCATLTQFHVIDTDDVGAEPRRQTADLSIAATDIEHTRGPGQLLSCERKDLFLILGVRAIGEAIDPPVCVRLPTHTVVQRMKGAYGPT